MSIGRSARRGTRSPAATLLHGALWVGWTGAAADAVCASRRQKFEMLRGGQWCPQGAEQPPRTRQALLQSGFVLPRHVFFVCYGASAKRWFSRRRVAFDFSGLQRALTHTLAAGRRPDGAVQCASQRQTLVASNAAMHMSGIWPCHACSLHFFRFVVRWRFCSAQIATMHAAVKCQAWGCGGRPPFVTTPLGVDGQVRYHAIPGVFLCAVPLRPPRMSG